MNQSYEQNSLRLDEEKKSIVVRYMPLVKFIAQRIKDRLPSHVMIEDLEHAGVLGLMEAVCRFDITHNNQFKTFAEHRIKGAILDDLRKNDWMSRTGREKFKLLESTVIKLEKTNKHKATSEEIAEALGLKMEEYFGFLNDAKIGVFLNLDEMVNKRDLGGSHKNGSLSQSEKRVWLDQVKKMLVEEVLKLKADEQLIWSLYYDRELTLKEIGDVMSKTESRICQVHNEIMQKLARRLRTRMQV